MQKINDLQEAYLCLKDKQLLVSVFGKRKSYFRLAKEVISVRNENLSCYISFEDFEELFAKQSFYLYEDEEEFVSIEKDKEYYAMKHK